MRNYIKKLFSVLLALTTFSAPVWGGVVEPIEDPRFEQVLSEITHNGFLTRSGSNSITLKVSEEYLDKLFPILVEKYGSDGLVKGSSTAGAHVSVVRTSIGEPALGKIPELNQIYEFTPIRIGSVVPDLDPKWERVWVLEISAPALENIRTSYGLTPLLHGDNQFHITIATKLKEGSTEKPLN